MNRSQQRAIQFANLPHEYDDDAICIHCGHDGAEAWHLRHSIPPEARPEEPQSDRFCTERSQRA